MKVGELSDAERAFWDSTVRILDSVTLGFDPATESATLRQVFEDRLARTFWLAVKPGHLVDQHFDANCLRLARAVRAAQRKREPVDATWIGGNLRNLNMIGTAEQEFCRLLLPFVRGEREIAFTITDGQSN